MGNLGDLIATVGLPSALVVFFVIVSWKRENILATRLDSVEDYQREQLVVLIESCKATLIESTMQMHNLSKSVKDSNDNVVRLINQLEFKAERRYDATS